MPGVISIEPDPWMRWIYASTHPDYQSAYAIDLRARREQAMRNAPAWMIHVAYLNDVMKKAKS